MFKLVNRYTISKESALKIGRKTQTEEEGITGPSLVLTGSEFRSGLNSLIDKDSRMGIPYKFGWDKTAMYIGLAGLTALAVRRVVLYYTTRCPSRSLLQGKTVIVTGANCGIGYETALELARRKARVILACRDLTKAEYAAKRIKESTGNEAIFVKELDLASLKSVRVFCGDVNQSEEKVDILINNAGVMKCPFFLTEDGFENHMAVNHYGNFLLTNLLKDSLDRSSCSRVVFVSSSLHRFGSVKFDTMNTKEEYQNGKPYSDSKLMNLLFARELHMRCSNDGKLCVYSVHPGMVRTQLARYSLLGNKYFAIFAFPLYLVMHMLYRLLVKTAREGCQTVVYCAVAPELDGMSDGYYGNLRKELWSGPACDHDLAKKVWEESAKLTKLV